MNDTFRRSHGRKVVSRTSAQVVGTVSDFILDASRRGIDGLVLGRGRKARVVDWSEVTAFGPDAVMVSDDAAVREPAGDRESLACQGKLDPIGKRVLSESGIELGSLDDVVFDPADGSVLALTVGGGEVPAEALLGLGSYAAVLAADEIAQP